MPIVIKKRRDTYIVPKKEGGGGVSQVNGHLIKYDKHLSLLLEEV